MQLDLMRDGSTSFPDIGQAEKVTSIRIWYCKYKTLSGLSKFPNVRELVIAGLPDASLSMLESLGLIEYLSIVHLPKISSLEPLAGLSNMRSLSLATNPAWDGSGRHQQIESLDPIAKLPALAHLELFGVCPPDRSLSALLGCKQLKTARFSRFPDNEVIKFFEATRAKNEFNPKSSFG